MSRNHSAIAHEADAWFRNYLKDDSLKFKHIEFPVGIQSKLWAKNCVAIGEGHTDSVGALSLSQRNSSFISKQGNIIFISLLFYLLYL